MFFNVLFGAMIAFNFYEPLARLIDSTGINWGFSDTLCMLGLFCISLVAVADDDRDHRPGHGAVPHARLSRRPPCLRPGRRSGHHGDRHPGVSCRAGAQEDLQRRSTTTAKPPFDLGLDHQWLGFFQYETGAVFSNLGSGKRDPYRQYGQGGPVNLFDPKAEWLLLHYDARPYGEGSVLGDEGGAEGGAAAGGAARSNNNQAEVVWAARRRRRRLT